MQNNASTSFQTAQFLTEWENKFSLKLSKKSHIQKSTQMGKREEEKNSNLQGRYPSVTRHQLYKENNPSGNQWHSRFSRSCRHTNLTTKVDIFIILLWQLKRIWHTMHRTYLLEKKGRWQQPRAHAILSQKLPCHKDGSHHWEHRQSPTLWAEKCRSMTLSLQEL